MKTQTYLRFALALAVLVCASTALASDEKTHHGTLCQYPNTHDLTWPTGIGLVNFSPSQDTAYCPVLRDNPNSTDGLVDLELRYYSTSTKPITCIAYSMTATGGFVASSVQYRNDASSDDTLDWNDDLDSSDPEGYIVITCTLASGTILGYVSKDP